MEFFRKQFDLRAFTFYPLGDWHVGSQQCNIKFIKEVIDEIKSSNTAYWAGHGDLMENAIVGSKSDVYKQEMPPKEQMDYIVELLNPIRHKGLFLLSGNHEYRTMRVVGLLPEQYISVQLGIPFLGYSCLATYQLMEAKSPQSFTCYHHHNAGGGYTKGAKINRSAKLREIVPTADATFSGHFHTTSRMPTTWYSPGRGQIIKHVGYDYCIGSALEYDNSYAEERAKTPATAEMIKVTFRGATSGRRDNREQIYQVITSNGRH